MINGKYPTKNYRNMFTKIKPNNKKQRNMFIETEPNNKKQWNMNKT